MSTWKDKEWVQVQVAQAVQDHWACLKMREKMYSHFITG